MVARGWLGYHRACRIADRRAVLSHLASVSQPVSMLSGLLQVGCEASSQSLTERHRSPWHTPSLPHNPLWTTAVAWARPRQALPAFCSGPNSAYLPSTLHRALSWHLSPSPSVPLDFSGASPFWAMGSPALIPTLAIGPGSCCGGRWSLPYTPPSPQSSTPPALTHVPPHPAATWGPQI